MVSPSPASPPFAVAVPPSTNMRMRNTKAKPARINKLSRALDEMRLPGAFLMQTHNRSGTTSWHIVSRHSGGPVTDGVANQLLRDPRIQPSRDGLLGSSQTYRLLSPTWRQRVEREQANPETQTVEKRNDER